MFQGFKFAVSAVAFAGIVYLVLAFPYFLATAPKRAELGRLPSYGEYQANGR